jgi:hypothetical protein
MREPRRLLEQDASDAERALLHSAHADGPPAGAAERMLLTLEGLTVGGGAPSASGASQASSGSISAMPVAAPSMKLGVLAKVGLAALIGAGAVGGGALVHSLTSQRPAKSFATSAAPGPAEAPGIPLLAAAPQATGPAPDESGTAPRQPPVGPPEDSLSAELRLLDAARAAVDARNPTAAQGALDRYAQRFPRGHLKPEAAVLHLAVLVQRGERAAARSLARQLLASATYRAYEPRIRSLLREAEN